MTEFKQASQGKLDIVHTDQDAQRLESQYTALNQRIANLRQKVDKLTPGVTALMDQLETLKNVDTASFAGSQLARIAVNGLEPEERDQLTAIMTIKPGDILTQESMHTAIAAIHQFNPQLECRFLRVANGDVVFRINGH